MQPGLQFLGFGVGGGVGDGDVYMVGTDKVGKRQVGVVTIG